MSVGSTDTHRAIGLIPLTVSIIFSQFAHKSDNVVLFMITLGLKAAAVIKLVSLTKP